MRMWEHIFPASEPVNYVKYEYVINGQDEIPCLKNDKQWHTAQFPININIVIYLNNDKFIMLYLCETFRLEKQ